MVINTRDKTFDDVLHLKYTHGIVIGGQKDTGKTTLARWILKNYFPRHMIFDPRGEYYEAGFTNVYIPKIGSIDEFDNTFCRAAWTLGVQNAVKYGRGSPGHEFMVVVDEAEQYVPNKGGTPLPTYVGNIVRTGRHVGIGYMFITHRVQDIHQTIMSMAEHKIYFKYDWDKDVSRLDKTISDYAYKLPGYTNHEFLVHTQGNKFLEKRKIRI